MLYTVSIPCRNCCISMTGANFCKLGTSKNRPHGNIPCCPTSVDCQWYNCPHGGSTCQYMQIKYEDVSGNEEEIRNKSVPRKSRPLKASQDTRPLHVKPTLPQISSSTFLEFGMKKSTTKFHGYICIAVSFTSCHQQYRIALGTMGHQTLLA
jgi:hypothetical protein